MKLQNKQGGCTMKLQNKVAVITGGSSGIGLATGRRFVVRSFARTWAAELKDRGIRVNVVSPGATDTPIIDGQFTSARDAAAAKAAFAEQTPLHRIGRPEELASAVLFLASDDSSFVTGIDLQVDGGLAQV